MSNTQQILLHPLDTCFFRDGKPFSRGEQSGGLTSMFPPFPSTVFGALRGRYISERGWSEFDSGHLRSDIGTRNSYKDASFSLKGVFLGNASQGNTLYYPLPRDLVVEKNALKKEALSIDAELLSLSQNIRSGSSLKRALLCNKPDMEYPKSAYMALRYLKSYLLSSKSSWKACKQSMFLKEEPKIGIKRNSDTHTVEEGHLYRIQQLRLLEDFCLVAEVSGIDFSPKEGILKLGGEQKAFACQEGTLPRFEYTDEEQNILLEEIERTKRFKLYLATPSVWRAGWRASWMDLDDTGQERLPAPGTSKTVNCTLLASALGNFQSIGGWDIARNRPKTMFRAVPSGSVYYLKLKQGTAQDVFDALHGRNLSDERSQEGFGLAYVGTIKEGGLTP